MNATSEDGTNPRPRRKANPLLLAAVTLGVLGAFMAVLVEGVLWAMQVGRPPNDYATVTWGKPIHNNALGFREREVDIPKKPGVLRVIVLGDSLTWGAGLAAEERYSALLETLLKAQYPNVEVLNFGLAGAPTTWERDILKKHIQAVAPDVVVVGFCINDPQEKGQNYAVELDNYQSIFKWFSRLDRIGFHHTAAFLGGRVDQLLRNSGRVPDWWDALDRTYQPESPQWQAFSGALADIQALTVGATGRPPVFMAMLQADGDYNHPDNNLSHLLKWTRQASREAQALGFKTVDLEPDFLAEGPRVRGVNPWDGHPDATCNAVYARNLAPVVSSVLALPPSENHKLP